MCGAVLNKALVFIGVVLTLMFGPCITAASSESLQVELYLAEFHRAPKDVMNRPLVHVDEKGAVVDRSLSPFALDLRREYLLAAKSAARDRICLAGGVDCSSVSGRKERWAAFDQANQIERFLYIDETQPILRNLLTMERERLLRGNLAKLPWTDSYWPMNRGLTARRWSDPGFPDSSDWQINFEYFIKNSKWLTFNNQLSPAEKYDALIGDPDRTLTMESWKAGQYHHERRGYVPAWQGLCHGWAPASIMEPNPKRSVIVLGASGGAITFYPSDIKALASQAWGEATPKINFVGVRCKVNEPKEDEYGRVIDPGCFDVNPGTWHMAIVNQIGIGKRGFVFDSTYDFQVWNYPIYAYKYSYFNPQTLMTSESLAGARVARTNFKIDKFKSYRSPQATHMVGIAMDVQYAVPTAPSSAPVLRPLIHTVKYVYDLELDQAGVIVGGEWYSNFHPDFIWNVPAESRPLSHVEKQMSSSFEWDGTSPLPREIRESAVRAAKKQQPLNIIVEALLRLATEEPGSLE